MTKNLEAFIIAVIEVSFSEGNFEQTSFGNKGA